MSNLKILHSDIGMAAKDIRSLLPYHDDAQIYNISAGKKSGAAKLATARTGTSLVQYDLGTGFSKSMSAVGIARTDRLRNNGVYALTIKGSSVSNFHPEIFSSLNDWIKPGIAPGVLQTGKFGISTIIDYKSLITTRQRVIQDRISITAGNRPTFTRPDNKSNWLLRSAAFDNAAWTKSNCSITADSTANPLDSAVNADTLVENSATAVHRVSQTFANCSQNQIYRASVYAKASTRTELYIELVNTAFSGTHNATINLSNGATISSTGLTLSVTSIGSGWYRVEITVTADANGTGEIRIAPSLAGASSYLGTGANSIIIYGAQFHDSDCNSAYLETTTDVFMQGLNYMSTARFFSGDYIPFTNVPVTTTDFTVAFVINLRTRSAPGVKLKVIDYEILNTSGFSISIDGGANPHTISVRTNQAGANTNLTSSAIITENQTAVVVVTKSGGTGTIYVNGTSVGSGALSNHVAGTSYSISSSTDPVSGYIPEVLLFDAALGTSDRNNIETYLTNEWKDAPEFVATTDDYLSVASGQGSFLLDRINEFAATASNRFWWLELSFNVINPMTLYTGPVHKVFFGTPFDFDVEVGEYSISRESSKPRQFVSDVGDLQRIARDWAKYALTLNWDGSNDDKIRDFYNNVLPLMTQAGCFIYTESGYPLIINSQSVLYMQHNEGFSENRFKKADFNSLAASFIEDLG